MFTIPDTFKCEFEDYLTLVPLREFAKEHRKDGIHSSKGRKQILDEIECYANQSKINLEVVESWLDKSICFGRKESYLFQVVIEEEHIKNLSKKEYIENCFKGKCLKRHRHVSGNKYDKNLSICNFNFSMQKVGKVLTIIACKMINTYDNDGCDVSRLYPIIINVYLEKSIMEVRVKPKAHMFEYEDARNRKNAFTHKTTTAEKEAVAVANKMAELVGIEIVKSIYSVQEAFKSKIYILLKSCTVVPENIVKQLEANRKYIEDIGTYYSDNVCKLSEDELNCFETDIYNVFEKYLSITQTDTTLFTEGKKMYPVRLAASDADTSKVDQTSAEKKPLQSRSIFFNNKSMIFGNEKCDGIQFLVKKDVSGQGEENFYYKIAAKKNYCVLSWTEYLKEDEINDVLYAIINL